MAKKTKRKARRVVKLLPMVVDVFGWDDDWGWEIVHRDKLPVCEIDYKSKAAAKRAGNEALARTKVAK